VKYIDAQGQRVEKSIAIAGRNVNAAMSQAGQSWFSALQQSFTS
jgi:hypothetical protein